MWTILRKFGWLAGVFLVLAPLSELRAAVNPAPNFHHTDWKGLGSVFDIKQSSDGYLWLTTSKGVVRFDGVRFQSIAEATNGAVDINDIDSVFLSSSGGLWLTTTGAGLLLWKDGQLATFPDRRCTPTRKQGKLIEDRDGSLWVQGASGLFHLRGSVCEQAGVKQGYPGGFAAGLLMDRDGTLWVKTRTGPLLYLPHGESQFKVSEYGDGLTTSYAFLHQAPDGAIWLSDDQGLRQVTNRISPPGKTSKEHAQFGDFTFAADGSLWAVTTTGVQRFDHGEPGERFTPSEGLSSDAAWKVIIDREESVWVGTNSGLDRLRHTALSTLALPHAQEHEFSVAAGDRGAVWTGNSDLPLTLVAADGAIKSFPRTRQTLCVRRDHNGTIWSAGMGGDSHLWRSSGAEFSPLHYPDEELDAVIAVAVDRNNEPWITARSGRVYHFADGKWSNQTKALGKKSGVIGAMTDDQAGNIWFAFSDKVVQWDGTAYHVSVRSSRGVSETTMSVRGEHVWLGGPLGVQLFTHGNFYTLQWKAPDLPGRVSGVVETETGDLWLNGFSGIAHVPAAELKKWLHNPAFEVSAEHLDELDGLPGLSGEKLPEPSVVESPEGRLWFATTKGVAWLDPAALEKQRNRVPPQVMIPSVISNSKNYPASMGVTLPARTENLEIDYTALSLAIPERVLFRYKLAGVDRDWQNAGTRRQAYYTKLRPGHYQFRVIACNNDGIWSDAGAALEFNVAPAWFQTTWFLLLCVACGVLLVSALYHLRVRQIAAGINASFDERLAERTRIAQELHDTLLQGFLSISMQVHVATDRLPADSPVRPALSRALDLMHEVIEEGRNAVRGLRSSHSASLDLEQAFARIQQELHPQDSSESPVGFRVVVQGEQPSLHPLLRDEVYRIGREALTNAFRHAHAKHIEVELRYTPNQFRLLVRDDGRGIAPKTLQAGRDGHWGLPGMRERSERIGATLHVFSSASAGTEIELTVPGRVAFERNPDGKRWWSWFRQQPMQNRRVT